MNHRIKHWIGRLHRDEGGTAAVSFILCLPIFLAIIAVIVQFALLVNAKVMVTNAAAAAARSAMTSLPEELPDNVKKAACFMLVPVSPKASTTSPEGQAFADALSTLQVQTTPDFAARYSYAETATTVDYPAINYKYVAGQDIEVTVHYKFYLTVPMAMGMLGRQVEQVAGVSGRFYTVSSTVRVQTAHGRGANSTGSGWAP